MVTTHRDLLTSIMFIPLFHNIHIFIVTILQFYLNEPHFDVALSMINMSGFERCQQKLLARALSMINMSGFESMSPKIVVTHLL